MAHVVKKLTVKPLYFRGQVHHPLHLQCQYGLKAHRHSDLGTHYLVNLQLKIISI